MKVKSEKIEVKREADGRRPPTSLSGTANSTQQRAEDFRSQIAD